MGLLRFARKEKAPSPSSRKPNSSTANFISSSAFQAIIQDTGATGSLLDDILKELHPTNEEIVKPPTAISSTAATSNPNNHDDRNRIEEPKKEHPGSSTKQPNRVVQATRIAREPRSSAGYHVQQQQQQHQHEALHNQSSQGPSHSQANGHCVACKYDMFHRRLPPTPPSSHAADSVFLRQHHHCHHHHHHHHYHHHHHHYHLHPPHPHPHQSPPPFPSRRAGHTVPSDPMTISPSCCHSTIFNQKDISKNSMAPLGHHGCNGHPPRSCHHRWHGDSGTPMRRSVSFASAFEGKEVHPCYHHHHHHHHHQHYYHNSAPCVQCRAGHST